jgi:hypothetical protein
MSEGWFKGLPAETERWMNDTLTNAGHEIEPDTPLPAVFKTGVALAKMVSYLTGEKV